jgi:hypothetical protein
MAMTDRCWRKSINVSGTGREFYPTDGAATNEEFVLPSMSTAFQVTIPEGTFAPGAGNFVLALFKTRANYKFSQRRVDISDLIATEKAKLKQEFLADAL